MWLKYLITIILFYFFAVLDNSLFAHFGLFGVVPNLVFILFYFLIFFEQKNNYYEIIFYSTIAGFFLDLFSPIYFGTSIVAMIIISLFTKKAQKLLRGGQKDNYPLAYFLPLFFISLLAYYLLLKGPTFSLLAETLYNLFFATIIFGIYKKFIFSRIDTRQLSLFK